MIEIEYLQEKARTAINDQIQEYKKSFIGQDIFCEITGLKLDWSICHVDHKVPFVKLLYDFVLSTNNHPRTVARNWEKLEEIWQKYHKKHASLRLLYSKVNLHRQDGDVDWHILNSQVKNKADCILLCEDNIVADMLSGMGMTATKINISVFDNYSNYIFVLKTFNRSVCNMFEKLSKKVYVQKFRCICLPNEFENWISFLEDADTFAFIKKYIYNGSKYFDILEMEFQCLSQRS